MALINTQLADVNDTTPSVQGARIMSNVLSLDFIKEDTVSAFSLQVQRQHIVFGEDYPWQTIGTFNQDETSSTVFISAEVLYRVKLISKTGAGSVRVLVSG